MGHVLEVRPGALTPGDLDALVQGLNEAPTRTGQVPRLIGSNGASIELPDSIRALLVSVVDLLKRGDGVSIIPLHAELTTVQAAAVLNVSRPHLVKQLEAGALPHHMIGTHRRLRLLDVLAYRDHLDAQATISLDAMSAEAEEVGLYQ